MQIHGRGELTRLMHATRIAYATLHRLANDEHVARFATAKKISAATGGAVSIGELCELPAPTQKSKRSKSTTSCAQPKLADART